MAEQKVKETETPDDIMSRGMDLVDLYVNKNYLINLDKCEPIPLAENEKSFSYMSLVQIDKIVFDPKENINDKLVSVYSALCNFGSTMLLVLASDESGVRFYLGTRDRKQPDTASDILESSLCGNFPGINLVRPSASLVASIMEEKFPEDYSGLSVSSVSIVPGMRDEKDKEHFVQGIEKFIDTMAGKDYTAVFVSSPLSKDDIEEQKRGYEDLYSTLSQCSQMVLSYGENESDSIAEGISSGFSSAVNEGISETTGKNRGTNKSRTKSHNFGFNLGFSGTGANSGSGRSKTTGSYQGENESHTINEGRTDTTSDTTTKTDTKTVGKSATLQITRHNKTVEDLLKKIDEQLERIKNCESYGLWNSAGYFVSKKEEVAVLAANTYKALVAGEKSSVENSFINLWEGEYNNRDKSLAIMEYLRYGMHPKFRYLPEFAGKDYEDQEVTAASLISGVELPILIGLPHKSVSGVTAIESAEFGRNVFKKSNDKKSEDPRKVDKAERVIDLGAVYHMGEVAKNNRVTLNLETLSSHCFITGSTGSGKSNTTYKMIYELTKPENNVKFLVIEPAKGEYKRAFGDMPGIHIYTTNPRYYSMLSINPFEFNEEIHVLEHLDRLIEIFSACWPLYAAMPAVLKSSFENAYIKHGWDLSNSIWHDLGNGKYPDFKDVKEILPVIMNESDYSADTRNDYIGSLVTRVESLTNGLIGQIFNGISIPDEVLFNENTIVDLSRVGSPETRGLIMGLLVLKLSEFRQATSQRPDLPLQHVTIMEEAHNLLKRTSTDQGQESSNVQGKSVEMISNSIAEMRTYGEGFVIVDQSPTQVDISAIKNTNTKIVMSLPEAADRETVGRSIGLKDEQILELSRLYRGVAAVYQNDWLEAVLTQIDKAPNCYELDEVCVNDREKEKDLLYRLVKELITELNTKSLNYKEVEKVLNSITAVDKTYRNRLNGYIKNFFDEYLKDSEKNNFSEMIYKIMNCGDLLRMYESDLPKAIKRKDELTDEVLAQAKKWANEMHGGLSPYANFMLPSVKLDVLKNLVVYKAGEDKKRSGQYKVELRYLQGPSEWKGKT